MPGSRMWCFTIHANESDGDQLRWPACNERDPPLNWLGKKNFKYTMYQVERAPETGKIHLQGFLCLSAQMTLNAIKKEYSDRAHWETSKGNLKQNIDYCSKQKSKICGPFQQGEQPKQGKRTDLIQVVDMIKRGKSDLEVMEELPEAARYSKEMCYTRFVYSEKQSDRQLQGVRVITLWGPTDKGKSYSAVNIIANREDYFILQCPSKNGEKIWFNGYMNQKTLIMDDFDASFCSIAFLKRILDKYKLQVETKGGFAWATWTTVIITCNRHPSEWYINSGQSFYKQEDIDAIRRRVCAPGNEIRHVTERGVYRLQDWEGHDISEDTNDVAAIQVPPTPDTVIPDTPAPKPRTCPPTQPWEENHSDGLLRSPSQQVPFTPDRDEVIYISSDSESEPEFSYTPLLRIPLYLYSTFIFIHIPYPYFIHYLKIPNHFYDTLNPLYFSYHFSQQ